MIQRSLVTVNLLNAAEVPIGQALTIPMRCIHLSHTAGHAAMPLAALGKDTKGKDKIMNVSPHYIEVN